MIGLRSDVMLCLILYDVTATGVQWRASNWCGSVFRCSGSACDLIFFCDAGLPSAPGTGAGAGSAPPPTAAVAQLCIPDDDYAMMCARVADIAGTVSPVVVTLNGDVIGTGRWVLRLRLRATTVCGVRCAVCGVRCAMSM